MAAAVDKARGPVGPSLADLAIGSPVPFPVVQPPRASDVRAGFLGLYIAPVNKQPAPAYLLNRTVNVKGVPRHSTERWYWSGLRARTRAGVCCLCSHRPHRPQTVFENSIGLLCGACVLPVFWCAVTER